MRIKGLAGIFLGCVTFSKPHVAGGTSLFYISSQLKLGLSLSRVSPGHGVGLKMNVLSLKLFQIPMPCFNSRRVPCRRHGWDFDKSKNIMKIKHDKEVDVIYLQFSAASITESDEDKPGIILDYAKNGSIVGIKILNASKKFPAPIKIEYEIV